MSEGYECVCERCGETPKCVRPFECGPDLRRLRFERVEPYTWGVEWKPTHLYLLCSACWKEVKAYVEEGGVGVTVVHGNDRDRWIEKIQALIVKINKAAGDTATGLSALETELQRLVEAGADEDGEVW